jgi:hypothetical protein
VGGKATVVLYRSPFEEASTRLPPINHEEDALAAPDSSFVVGPFSGSA